MSPSKLPEEWRLGELALVSCMMGGIAVGSSLLVLHISLEQMASTYSLAKPLEYGQVITVM